MFNRLATVLQELSGEERPDGEQQDMLDPQPADGESEDAEDATERPTHLEQLVVQLKELIREKDAELTAKDARLKSEKEEAEARFTKLKLQAKAKMASLNKQITELKGQTAANQSPDSSFSGAEEENNSRKLAELLQEKDSAYAEQLRALQAVVCEKDARFQEQIQKHEEELQKLTIQHQHNNQLMQDLEAAQQKCLELQETLNSRSEELEMLQQEISSADQQKQILTAQFRQMEQELSEAVRDRQQWAERAGRADEKLRANLEALERERTEVSRQHGELDSLREANEKQKEEVSRLEAELCAVTGTSGEREPVQELETLRESLLEKDETLAEVWAHLRCFHPGDAAADPALLLDTARAAETQMTQMKDECDRFSQNLQTVREQLEVKTTEEEEARVRIQQLEQQLSDRSDALQWPQDRSENEAQIRILELRLAERENELATVRASLTPARKPSSVQEDDEAPAETSVSLPDLMEDAQEEETTLVAEDASESSPELQSLHSESKGNSSDEMVASSDSEVVHSSWTLLDEGQEWSSTSIDQESSVRETGYRDAAEELQKLKEAAAESQRKIKSLEEESESLRVAKKQCEDQSGRLLKEFEEQSLEKEMLREQLEVLNDENQTKQQTIQKLQEDLETTRSAASEQLEGRDVLIGQLEASLHKQENSEAESREMSDLNESLAGRIHRAEEANRQLERESTQRNEELENQLSNTKKKLQAALLHRKDLMKKVSDLESQARNFNEPSKTPRIVEHESRIAELEGMLKTKEEETKESTQSLSNEMTALRKNVFFLQTKCKALQEKHQEAQERRREISQQAETNERRFIKQKEEDRREEEDVLCKLKTLQHKLESQRGTSGYAPDDNESTEQLGELIRGLQERLEARSKAERRAMEESEEKQRNQCWSNLIELEENDQEEDFTGSSETDPSFLGPFLEQQYRTHTREIQAVLKESTVYKELQEDQEHRRKLSEDSVKTLREEIQALQQANAELEMKLEAFHIDLSQKEAELKALRDKEQPIGIQQHDSETPGDSLESLREEIQALQQANAELRVQLEARRDPKGVELHAVGEELKVSPDEEQPMEFETPGDSLEFLREEIQFLQQTNSELQTKLQESQTDLSQKGAELLAVQEELKSIRDKEQPMDFQQESSETPGDSLESLREEIQTLQQTNAEFQMKLEESQADLSQKEAELLGVEEELKSIRDKEQPMDFQQESSETPGHSLESLREEIQFLQQTNAELQMKLEESQADLSQKEAELLGVEEELKSIRDKEQPMDFQQESSETPGHSLESLREEIQFLQQTNAELQMKLEESQADLSQKEAELHAMGEESKALQDKLKSSESPGESLTQQIAALQRANSELQAKLQESHADLNQKEAELHAVGEELKALREKERQMDFLSEEIRDLREKHVQAQLDAEALKRELESASSAESSIPDLRAEVENFKRFMEEKNLEISDLSGQLGEQSAFIRAMQETVSRKDELISELQKEREESEEKNEARQRKLQAALIARKEALRENKSQREQLAELERRADAAENQLEKLREEKERLTSEVDRMLRENQSATSTCESLKLAMEAVLGEKEASGREWQEKLQGAKDEYETLLRSYENASGEAERAGKAAEAARRERRELAARAREEEAARREAQSREEEARKEAELLKEKMRKFAKSKQLKISELEEENERLREAGEQSADVQKLLEELDAAAKEKNSLREQLRDLQEQINHQEEEIQQEDGILTQTDSASGEMKADVEKNRWKQKEAELLTELDSLQRDLNESKEREAELTEEAMRREVQLKDLEEQIKQHKREKEMKDKQEEEESQAVSAGRIKEEELQTKLDLIQRDLTESREREARLTEEVTRTETRLRELEAEKDDLEERLMNQLAELNGGMAGCQQEAAELRLEVERLEAEARRAVSDGRSAQRVKEGGRVRARQLEELLREKQLEVRQLQKDSIRYQEKISEQIKETKALRLNYDELLGQLEQTRQHEARALQDLKKAEDEIKSCKLQLAEAEKQTAEASAGRTAAEQKLLNREAALKAEAEQTLDSVRFRLGAELKEAELRLEESYAERERQEEVVLKAREAAAEAEKRARNTQSRLDESVARLAAFSRSMSSLQDDRDRVLDEARQWETRFHSSLRGKEEELWEAETRAKHLTEHLEKESGHREELQLSVSRLEKADQTWQLRLEEEEKKIEALQSVLEEERSKLQLTAAELQSAREEVRTLRSESESLRQRGRALEEAVGKLQSQAEQTMAELREREAEERRLCLSVEQLETDLRSSKVLTESLQTELQGKEQREVELLGEKEQAVAQAAEEARKEADARAQEAEEKLEKKRGEAREAEEKLRKAEDESSSRKSKLDSFTKAMGSLQDDRDRVVGMYKQLEEKHLQVMMEKDSLIQEAAGENNGLKEELRSLLVQRDDLHAEKAKLAAQLHGYRNELNQVLGMKESQHKQLLAAQREQIASLERERDAMEKLVRDLKEPRSQKVERETPSRAAPGAEVEKLKEQLEALQERLLSEAEERQRQSKELAELRWEGGVMRTESESAQERVAELARDLLLVEQRLLEEVEKAKRLRAENQSFSKAMASLQDSRDQAVRRLQELSLKLEEASKAGDPAGEVWSLKNALQALQNDRERLLEQLKTQSGDLKKQKSELSRLGAGELIKISQELFEEKRRNEDVLGALSQLEEEVELGKQEIETLRLERADWTAQAEQLKQQTLTTLSEKDQQIRQLAATLDQARAHKPKLQQERYQSQGTEEVESAPGAPQERSGRAAELGELQQRLEDEIQQRMQVEEQMMVMQDQLKRQSQATWRSSQDLSETAVFIEPSEGAVTRTRRGGPGVTRMLRVALCSRQRTPALLGLYLLTVHVLLILCMGGYL